MTNSRLPVIVVGGGAAGLIAAWRVATHGIPTILVERNRKLGIKVLISGGGKCNLTHAGSIEELLKAFRPQESRFLRHALHCFSNAQLVGLLDSMGLSTYARDNGRVFPREGTAHDVMRVFERLLRDAGVGIRLNARARNLTTDAEAVTGVQLQEEFLLTRHVILATGGVSYPQTGTTGDGIRWAERAGHSIVPLRAALAPLVVKPEPPAEWQGVAIRGGRLSVVTDGRTVTSWSGDILFTHEGISGPAALEVSRSVAELYEQQSVELRIDFYAGEEFASVDERLTAVVRESSGKTVENLLVPWLPNRLVAGLLNSIGIDPETRGYSLTREARRKIVHCLKGWRVGRVTSVDIRRGEVSAGGVALTEVDPRTMRSGKLRGLYLCGELLDIAGPVGGYNLQAAFSTGFLAGEAASDDWRHEAQPIPRVQ